MVLVGFELKKICFSSLKGREGMAGMKEEGPSVSPVSRQTDIGCYLLFLAKLFFLKVCFWQN
jgi:hypothetical protein